MGMPLQGRPAMFCLQSRWKALLLQEQAKKGGGGMDEGREGGWKKGDERAEEAIRQLVMLEQSYKQRTEGGSLTTGLKVFVGFVQVSSAIGAMTDVPLPPAFLVFVSTFQLISFDFIPWSSILCVAAVSFYSRFVLMGLTPLIALVLVHFLLTVLSTRDAIDMSDDSTQREANKAKRYRYLKLFWFTAFLMYPTLSAQV